LIFERLSEHSPMRNLWDFRDFSGVFRKRTF
jgi:hypothetical protein